MAFPCLCFVGQIQVADPSLRAKRSNPQSLAEPYWIASSLTLLAMTMGYSRLPCHLLRLLAEHVLARLFIERLLDEFADGKSCLHLRPRTHVRIPALDVRII